MFQKACSACHQLEGVSTQTGADLTAFRDEGRAALLLNMLDPNREVKPQFVSSMFQSFTDKADLTPYKHEPARIDLNAINPKTAYGAERSSKMDFSDYDRINDFELNEILWRAIKGQEAPLPPAVRRAIAFRPTSAK